MTDRNSFFDLLKKAIGSPTTTGGKTLGTVNPAGYSDKQTRSSTPGDVEETQTHTSPEQSA